jgi:uncharacterized protein YecE (DUF72 family)
VLLAQLPPSLPFDEAVATGFFQALRDRHRGSVVCEPRHPSWFGPPAEALLRAARVGRVAADPAVVPGAAVPGGWEEPAYWRLHGSPRVYHSAYADAALDRLAATIGRVAGEAWCIFDNTAAGAAAGQALDLVARLTGNGLS